MSDSFCYRLAMLLFACATVAEVRAAEPAGGFDFFEMRIRPVLVEHCYECHNSADTAEGGLAVDYSAALLAGGDGGPTIVPGRPDQSRLLAILRHEIEGLEMPSGGPQLDAATIADFERWIAMGAPDPREQPPSAEQLAAATSWEVQMERRKQWWSFQPIPPREVPHSADSTSDHAIDCFIDRRLAEANLRPVDAAPPHVLVRRMFYALTGLPPSLRDAEIWSKRLAAAKGPQRRAIAAELADYLLASPRFGERWARHWMDWVRYAESHGSEGDPTIEGAWEYRDYLIRALNADVPLDQLIREHVAGDLLSEPRQNVQLGINESAIGPAHWRMVFHGFAPTDALDERVRFTDDQINAFSKAFLGLTVSCARCHHHKFDPISQDDYYALFGVLASCRPGRRIVDLPEVLDRHNEELTSLKGQIRQAVAEEWRLALDQLASRIRETAANEQTDISLLAPWQRVQEAAAKSGDVGLAWREAQQSFEERHRLWQRLRKPGDDTRHGRSHWDLALCSDYEQWYAEGNGLPQQPLPSGHFSVASEGDAALLGIYPAGVCSHTLSTKHAARLASRDQTVKPGQQLWVLARGGGEAAVRFVVQDYPRSGTVYPVKPLSPNWAWHQFDLSYWEGDEVHVELATARDAPLLVQQSDRSWFAVRHVVLQEGAQAAPAGSVEHLDPLFAAASIAPSSIEEAAAAYRVAIERAVDAWQRNTISDAEALLLDQCLQLGLLPNQLSKLPAAAGLIERYRQLEGQVPVPRRVPGLDETAAADQPLFLRGDHRQAGALVPRRFLEAIDSTPYTPDQSGRLQLARDLLRDDNPLTRRVMVNRVWHHLFGHGIVRTPDNVGRLGDRPSHPELLDWLALRFQQDGWSMKQLIRLIVTSDAWQRSSTPPHGAPVVDPENRLLSHANVRRLEAEALRDTLLTVSGEIEHLLGGPPVDGTVPRRSIYIRVHRNSLDPFLRTFDFPEPYSSVGRRDVTNVPAQSLLLLNSPHISAYSDAWSRRVLENASLETDRQRVQHMFGTALGRPPYEQEVAQSLRYLAASRENIQQLQHEHATLLQEVQQHQLRIAELKEPIRQQLEAARQASEPPSLPVPLLAWDFTQPVDDKHQHADLQLVGDLERSDRGLSVGRDRYAITAPLDASILKKPLAEKTLEAWVQLDNLDQRGGGVLSVQTPDGATFDAIVFGEREPRQWLAGSNNFARTKPFLGDKENEADRQPVHVAIAYHTDGTVVGYRNGKPYGEPYQSNGPQVFAAGETVISVGLRHLPATGNRFLSGHVLKVRLYDRALSAEEIGASAATALVSDEEILAALAVPERDIVQRLGDQVVQLEQQIASLQPVPTGSPEAVAWSELARAMFLFKELIYVQ